MNPLSQVQLQSIFSQPEHIRHVLVLCTQKNSNFTLIDSLIAKTGTDASIEDRNEDKQHLLALPHISLLYEHKSPQTDKIIPHIINLFYPNQNSYLCSELVSNICIVDGAILIVDCIEGLSISLEAMLKHAISQKIIPVLTVNNVYQLILGNEQNLEFVYQRIVRIIDAVNLVVSTSASTFDCDILFCPKKGNMVFECGKGVSWTFILSNFASLYSKKFNIDMEKLKEKFWGEHFYNPESKQWGTQSASEDGLTLTRGFVQMILKPIVKLAQSVICGNEDQLRKLLTGLQIKLSNEELDMKGPELLKAILFKWTNNTDSLLESIIIHLPSPTAAQKYRASVLYSGPQNDDCATAIKECNPNGPLMMNVSKIVPNSEKGELFAIGRVFSGTISTGQTVRIMGSNYVPGKKEGLSVQDVKRTMIVIGRNIEISKDVPCGNIVVLTEIDQCLPKSATLSNFENAYTFRVPKYCEPSIFRVNVEPQTPEDLPKLVESLRGLEKSDVLLSVEHEETGEHVLTGMDYHHLNRRLDDLRNQFAAPDFKTSDIYTIYKETITQNSETMLAKSPNKHNRFYCSGQPLSESFAQFVEKGKLDINGDPKLRTKQLCEEFGWETQEANRIWAFGPDLTGPNIFVDMTVGVQYRHEIKDSTIAGFQWAMKFGILCEESMRQVRINLVDLAMMSDSIHRSVGQVLPTVRRICFACELMSEPRLQEAIVLQEIIIGRQNIDMLPILYEHLNRSRGIVLEEESLLNNKLNRIIFYMPAKEVHGFQSALKSDSLDCQFCESVFSHWDLAPGNPLIATSYANRIISEIRKRKGLQEEIPSPDRYHDKL